MRIRPWSFTLVLLLISAPSLYAQVAQPYSNSKSLQKLAALPVGFEPTGSQKESDARFLFAVPGYSASFSQGDVAIAFAGPGNEIVHLKLEGDSSRVEPEAEDVLPGVTNYYVGHDPNQWKTNVRQFRQIRYRDIYPGVDLVFYGTYKQLEFDFDVSPGADVNCLRLELEGASLIRQGGDLLLKTPLGKTAILKKPDVYQKSGSKQQKIGGSYQVRGNEIAFLVGPHDRQKALVIDPALVYSTFAQIGAPDVSLADSAFGIAVDSSGASYITGQTTTNTTSAFVLKLDPSGSTLVYKSLLGGSLPVAGGTETTAAGTQIAVDSQGNAYVVGMTVLPDFPTTPGSYSPNVCGAVSCFAPFAVKFDANGRLVYSTFLVKNSVVDTAGPVPSGIAIDSTGAIYVTGIVAGQGHSLKPPFLPFPVAGLATTSGAFQATRKTDLSGFALKLHPDGSTLDYATYLGGSTGEFPGGIAVDPSGVAYVDGGTASSDFPTTPGAFQTTNPGTSAFFAKLKPDGSGLLYSTFLGGTGIDSNAMAITVDGSNSAYIAGATSGNGFPTTAGAFKTSVSIPPGVPDFFFVSKFDSSNNVVYSTYIGDGVGSNREFPPDVVVGFFVGARPPASIFVDQAGSAYVEGFTVSPAFPSVGSFAPNPTGKQPGSYFVTKINPAGSDLSYSIFPPPIVNVPFAGMALDASQNVYLAGTASDIFDPVSGDLVPGLGTTTGALQPLPNGMNQSRMFVEKITPSLGAAVPVPSRRLINFSPILQKGVTSAPRMIQINNYGDAPLTVSGVTISGANSSDFSLLPAGNTCGTAIAIASSCSFQITFTPSVDTGTRNGTINLTFGGGLSSQAIALVGAAGIPVFSPNHNPLDFGNMVPGGLQQQCAFSGMGCVKLSLTVTNSGTAPLNFLAAPAIAGADSGDFFPAFVAGGFGPYIVPPTLNPGDSVFFQIGFIPTATGTRTAQLVLQTDISGGSQQVVPLTGTGLGPGNGNFTIFVPGGNSSTSTITAGQSANFNLMVATMSNFSGGTITVSCSGLPAAASCTAKPDSFNASSGSAILPLSVTVTTTARSVTLWVPDHRIWWISLALLAMALTAASQKGHRGARRILIALPATVILLALISCGGGQGSPMTSSSASGTPAGTSTITITATANGSSNSAALTLVVN